MTKQNNKVESFKFKGIISGTSNKISSEFKNDNPRKTCYIKVNKENEKILLENGLTKYTSKEDEEDFFIIKFSETVSKWVMNECEEMDTSTVSNNFYTEKEIGFACIKGKNKGNDYVRIYALGVQYSEDIILTEKSNPFEDEENPEGNPF